MNKGFRQLTVSQINEYIGMVFDSDMILANVSVVGEITDFKYYPSSGHMYFSLKDSESVLKSVMFRSSASRLSFVPKNGMKVVAAGRIGVYPKSGAYQLYVSSMKEDGKGSAAEAFERLKKKLESEGLFDSARKRPIPEFPRRIGVITSPKGAALQDILNVSGRRWNLADVVICPSAVQGELAPFELREAMRYFNTYGGVDLVIIGRGGGSGEDLSAFNDEELARLVGASPVPVISAVGHETDFTICDFVADKRAPTPSAASELATPDKAEISDMMDQSLAMMKSIMARRVLYLREKLSSMEKGAGLYAGKNYVSLMKQRVESLEDELIRNERSSLDKLRGELGVLASKFEGINPLGVLSRGYAYITNRDGERVDSAKKTAIGENLKVRFESSCISVEVTECESECE